MKTKLTLSIERQVIEEAKEYAREENTTLSALLENHLRELIIAKNFKNLSRESKEVYQAVKPAVRKKLGILDELERLVSKIPPSTQSPSEVKAEHLQKKLRGSR